MCFPFVLSSQTESAALRAREEAWDRGLEIWGPPPHSPEEFLGGTTGVLTQIIYPLLWRLSWWSISQMDPCLEAGAKECLWRL